MLKGIIFSAILSLSAGSAFAEVMELDHGLTIDLDSRKEVRAACTPVNASDTVPGSECITQCYDVVNDTNGGYTCDLNASSSYYEVFVMTDGENSSTMETGNTLTATDMRDLSVFPYSTATVCFNFGKYTGNGLWVYQDGSGKVGGTCLAPPQPIEEGPAPQPALMNWN